MKPLRSLVLCVLLLCSLSAGAKDGWITSKDFAGHWEGVLHVTIDGKPATFPFVMDIVKDGTAYAGRNLLGITFPGGEAIYIRYNITGSVSAEKLSFKDDGIIEKTMPKDPAFYWCAKSGTLSMGKGPRSEDVLSGPVTGYSPNGDCLPATAELRRK